MFESSHADTMCFPSDVNDAHTWFPPFLWPIIPLYLPITLIP
ncbi:hypothetical protein HanXRQr2_Chr07g0317091 [Helianthus annuus]|uniref:Uncharacterized protein n=1 Tax=Helianthus annuus TaxID=4232 RepID=A0A9K3IP90_HELAN|nr:hypothetical protein HanXRQr2_Chr07g0317091 [Helianthus annuus]